MSGLIACIQVATADAAAPKLVVEETHYDFGSVPRGTLVKKTFVIRNEGSAPLVISKAEFSTPGLHLKVSQQIDPGTVADLEVKWDTGHYTREVEAKVALWLNDPVNPTLILTLSGIVISPIDILPAPAFYLSQFRGQSVSQDIMIQNNQNHDIKITGLDRESDLFSISYAPIKEGKTFALRATVAPTAPVGRHREAIVVHTDDPQRDRMRIEVNILVKPDVYLNVDALDLGEISIRKLQANPESLPYLTQTFIVTRRAGEMRITGLDSDIPFLSTGFDPQGPSQTFRVDVGLKPEALEPGLYAGRLVLHTDDAEFPQLTLPVRAKIIE